MLHLRSARRAAAALGLLLAIGCGDDEAVPEPAAAVTPAETASPKAFGKEVRKVTNLGPRLADPNPPPPLRGN